jgi:hypothetical protein
LGLFRKHETYNEQMLREAGLDRVVFNEPPAAPEPEPDAEPVEAPPLLGADEVFLGRFAGRVKSGPLEWDAVVSVRAPSIAGDRVDFTTLPNGDLIVEEEKGDGDLSPLADAVEKKLDPPYMAAGTRHGADVWAVGAKRIEVAEFAFPDAEALELSQTDGESELRVGGDASDAAVPVELQRLGERVGSDFCVDARRIDGDSWEVRVSAL